MIKLGICIKVGLAQRDMSNDELAIKLGVSKMTVSNYISKNNCDLIMLQKISEVFEIETAELLALGDL